jgi:hypothetical protein
VQPVRCPRPNSNHACICLQYSVGGLNIAKRGETNGMNSVSLPFQPGVYCTVLAEKDIIGSERVVSLSSAAV